MIGCVVFVFVEAVIRFILFLIEPMIGCVVIGCVVCLLESMTECVYVIGQSHSVLCNSYWLFSPLFCTNHDVIRRVVFLVDVIRCVGFFSRRMIRRVGF